MLKDTTTCHNSVQFYYHTFLSVEDETKQKKQRTFSNNNNSEPLNADLMKNKRNTKKNQKNETMTIKQLKVY